MIRFLQTRLISGVFILGILAVATGGGAWLHFRFEQSEFEAYLAAENARLQQEKAALGAMVDRLSRSHRKAQIVVLDQKRIGDADTNAAEGMGNSRQAASDPAIPHLFENLLSRSTAGDADVIETTLLIAELDDGGNTVSKQCVTIPGRTAFFDGLVVKFDLDSVAAGHPLRGRSIALLRRVYSERLSPENGILMDLPDVVPAGYRIDDASDAGVAFDRMQFEQRVWSHFWTIANDPELAAELGVRVAQGEAVYKPMLPGVLYELTIDAAGGLNLETKPLPTAVADVLAAVSGENAKSWEEQ